MLKHIKLGHVTLTVDEGHPPKLPGARLSGGLTSRENTDDEAVQDLYVDNDSGRYGQYSDLHPNHLAYVRLCFELAFGEPVKVRWINMELEGEEQKGPPSLKE
jgi:hypothetical protein